MRRTIVGMAVIPVTIACLVMGGCARSDGTPVSQPQEVAPEAFAKSLRTAIAQRDHVLIDKLVPADTPFSRWEHAGEGQHGPARSYEALREKTISEIIELFSHPDVTTRSFTEDGNQFVELNWRSPRRWDYRLRIEIVRSESGQWRAKRVVLGAQYTATK